MKYLTSGLKDIPWVRHGFFTRQGGASGGIFGSLNCGPGSGDDPAHVAENRRRVAAELGVSGLATLRQVHSARAVLVDKLLSRDDMPPADALVTAAPGFAVGVLTADCGPVLFASRRDKVVAAAHAGWKGAVGGILEATVTMMRSRGVNPADIAAALGPCIGPLSYEVGGDFPAPFLAQDKRNEKFFRKADRPGHLMFDMPAYITHRLNLLGVTHVENTMQDTLADEESYFSYRRACRRGEADYGRQVSAITIVS